MLKLIPPGKRRGNPFYVVRGRFLEQDIEASTGTLDETVALEFKNRLERKLLEGRVPGPEATVTFRRAADLYSAAKPLSKADQARIDRLKEAIADKPVRDVLQADIDAAANLLHGADTPETKNRNVYTPAGAILHYAYHSKWCDWIRLQRPKQRQPETRATAAGVPETLLAATDGKQHLLLLWLFKHGTRISGTLSVECERIDLKSRTYDLYITKNRTWRTFPIDDEVWELLANDADVQAGTGRLFPWQQRWAVYEWLKPLCKRLKVKMTPHMARHWLGKDLNKNGAGLRTIMAALGQSNYKSAIRYVAEDIDAVRAAMKAGSLGKNKKVG